jgi:hypothetical protein
VGHYLAHTLVLACRELTVRVLCVAGEPYPVLAYALLAVQQQRASKLKHICMPAMLIGRWLRVAYIEHAVSGANTPRAEVSWQCTAVTWAL